MDLEEKLKNLPDKPGAYLFKDESGAVLYVGKAASLRSRVRSYFQKVSTGNPRLELLKSKIRDLDYILCDSEMEALLLEHSLIKENHPRFNVRFRDDKRYPMIKAVVTDPFPYVTLTRKRADDGNRYFGPFVSSRAMRQTLRLIRKIFQTRSCSMKITGHDRPCLYYHIKECTAPCISAIGQKDYRDIFEGVLDFLEGKSEPLLRELNDRMQDASEKLDFERAAIIRDQIDSVKETIQRQKVSLARQEDEDYAGVATDGDLAVGVVFHLKKGTLIGKDHRLFENAESSPSAALSAFIRNYYRDRRAVAPQILVAADMEDRSLIEKFLSGLGQEKVEITVAKRGDKKKLLILLEKNAAHQLGLARAKEARTQGMLEALLSLQTKFKLPALPVRIECYDISTLAGRESVASMVVFQGGKPEKSHYRKFFLGSFEEPDDFAMMKETLFRRLRHLSEPGEEDPSFSSVPDLILLDGGRGQLSAGIEVLKSLALAHIPILSLAKEEEEIHHPELSAPVRLSRHDTGLQILQHARDEAHRFAVSFHKTRRGKKFTSSTLEEIPGIGKNRAQKLLEAFGSISQIKVADPAQISSVLRCSLALARSIADRLC